MSKPLPTSPSEHNTQIFGWFVIYGDVCFDPRKLPEGDENLIPPIDFYRMMVEAALDPLTLEEVLAQATKMGYTY